MVILMNNEENKKSFLEELQSLDEPTKRKAAILVTIVAMVIVVYIWFGYFNGLVSNVTQVPAADNPSAQASGEPSFAGNIKNGMAMIGGGIVGSAKWFSGLFTGPGQYVVRPTSNQ